MRSKEEEESEIIKKSHGQLSLSLSSSFLLDVSLASSKIVKSSQVTFKHAQIYCNDKDDIDNKLHSIYYIVS